MQNYKQIISVTGKAYTVPEAFLDLCDKLNELQSNYEFINNAIVTIDREVTSTSRSVVVYVTQILGRK